MHKNHFQQPEMEKNTEQRSGRKQHKNLHTKRKYVRGVLLIVQFRWTQLVVCVNIASQWTQRIDQPNEQTTDRMTDKRCGGWWLFGVKLWFKFIKALTLARQSAQLSSVSQMDKQYLIWLTETICGDSSFNKSWMAGCPPGSQVAHRFPVPLATAAASAGRSHSSTLSVQPINLSFQIN